MFENNIKRELDLLNLNEQEKNQMFDNINQKRKAKRGFRLPLALALSTSFVVMIGSIVAYSMPYSYISVDINPSIELELNVFDRVISSNALNEDGEILLNVSNVKNSSLKDALSSIMHKLEEQGYFIDNESIVVGAVSKDKEKANTLLTTAQESIAKNNNIANNEITIIGDVYTTHDVEVAHQSNTTPGKLGLIKKLESYMGDTSLSEEALIKMSISDILAYLISTSQSELELVFSNVEDNSKNDALLNKLEHELEKYKKQHNLNIDVDLEDKDDINDDHNDFDDDKDDINDDHDDFDDDKDDINDDYDDFDDDKDDIDDDHNDFDD